MDFREKNYCSLVLWMSSTAPRTPIIKATGNASDGNSGMFDGADMGANF